ncbi:DUF4157 domain-containing protein [Myxococcus sp. CA039A]|uniref:eCIS core domain-containing protein n=1 Tax=Myxococcus sp. CA039A TaxID=2741737 RepID=UPI00157B4254|nr:DUF4157 domain-containing protein [Myxococcus sp. CA039A]NTX50024.1 DUF4157 domain-containing protein [Myxococcus sp. CA039A]
MFAFDRKPQPSAARAPAAKTEPRRSSQARQAEPTDPGPRFDFARISVMPPTPRIHPKLRIGAPDDALEREADAVADRVVGGGDAQASQSTMRDRIQRKCSTCEDEEGPSPLIQRKCGKCAEEEPEGTLQRKADSGATAPAPDLQSQLSGSSGGQQLPTALGGQLGASMGTPFDRVRIHTDDHAARMNSSLGARAFTHGTHIYFNQGEYNPGTRAGRHLLAHELAHVAQQGGAGHTLRRKGGAPASGVSLVEIACADNTITFHASTGPVSYQLTQCDIVDGEFDANVVIDAASNSVRFDIQSNEVAAEAFQFGFSIAPGQLNPVTLFRGQTTVKLSAKSGMTTLTAATSLAEFKQRVKEAGKLRMDSNKARLEEWKKFFTEKLSANQVQGQVMASRANELGMLAASEGGMTMLTFDKWARTDNPLLGWVYEQQIEGRYRACTGCHALVQAEDRWRNRPAFVAPARSPVSSLQEHAQAESANPAPRLHEGPDAESTVADPNKFTGYESAQQAMQAVKTLRPYLDELGPARYDILPLDIFSTNRSPAALLARIISSIDKRQADYDLFKTKIDSADFDYLLLRPIVQDLMLLATPEVQQQVLDEIASAQRWEIAQAIVMGAATVGLLVLTIFPPTSPVGVAGVIALETSLATYGAVSGLKMYQEGSMLSLTQGANNVVDPAQQKAADTMMAMGLVSVGLSALSLGTTGIRAVTIIRGARTGEKTVGAAVAIEAQLQNGGTVKISELVGGSPRVVVLGKDGELLAEGVLTDAALLGSKPTKLAQLPDQGIQGVTPRAASPGRPLSFQGPAPTCGPVSCEMIASMGGPVSPTLLKDMLKGAGPSGTTIEKMVEMLKWNRVAAEAKTGWKVADLASATQGGNPAIAVIKTNNPTHPLHAVVIDGVTVRSGVKVVAVRNPWGIQYFQSEAEFSQIFTGQAVKVLHWY